MMGFTSNLPIRKNEFRVKLSVEKRIYAPFHFKSLHYAFELQTNYNEILFRKDAEQGRKGRKWPWKYIPLSSQAIDQLADLWAEPLDASLPASLVTLSDSHPLEQ